MWNNKIVIIVVLSCVRWSDASFLVDPKATAADDGAGMAELFSLDNNF